MLTYILASGTYGTKVNSVANRMRKMGGKSGRVTAGTRLRYYVRRAFPGQDALCPYYHPLARFKAFIPLVWGFRILRGVTFRAKKICAEIKIVQQQKEI